MEKIIKFLFGIMTPFVKFMNKCLNMPFSKKRITGDHYYLWRDSIKKGHVLLTSTNGSGSNLINISGLNHGAIYFGRNLKSHIEQIISVTYDYELKDRLIKSLSKYNISNNICYVLESVYDGVIPTNLVKFMTTKDVFLCSEPVNDEINMTRAADMASLDIGLGYDYKFSESTNSRYCFELVAIAYESANPIFIIERTVFKLFGIRLYSSFLSDSFTNSNWRVIVDSRK